MDGWPWYVHVMGVAMDKIVGVVKQLNRFPVKSMQGESILESHVDWNGLDGDRRYAFVRSDILAGFPWLTGRQIPDVTNRGPQSQPK